LTSIIQASVIIGSSAAHLTAWTRRTRNALSFPGELQKLSCRQSSILIDARALRDFRLSIIPSREYASVSPAATLTGVGD
jgi:hypothetical protein